MWEKRMLEMISMSIKLHERMCIAKYACTEVNGVQDVGQDTHERYIIKVTQAQVFNCGTMV